MGERTIEADYVIKGAGAVGMAFADSILSGTDASIVLVDRRDRPGGHWADAYPFVRLHQPARTYGVASLPLGSGATDRAGLNAGYHTLASGQEVLGHFDRVMQERFLPSGRVRFVPMSDLDDDGVVTNLISGERTSVSGRTWVDATWSQMQVPSVTPPPYEVADGVACAPLNDLPRTAPRFSRFVVVGAGKTGMDACVWLLSNGTPPDAIRWIVPRDSWILDRANVQSDAEHFARLCKSLADQVEAAATASTIDDLFARLESSGELRRLDPSVEPQAYHCAILSNGEVEQLRRIDNVVRLGRVRRVEPTEIVLEDGTIPTGPDCLHVDCSAAGIPGVSETPVFEADRITLQWVRTCQPTFSAAFVGHVEATFDDEAEKNTICTPIAPPTVPRDWLRMMHTELGNRATWAGYPALDEWIAACRLDPFRSLAGTELATNAEASAHVGRYVENVAHARENLGRLLGE